MGLGRLLNVFYSFLVEAAGGDAAAQQKIDRLLLESESQSELQRKEQAAQNRDSIRALSALFSQG